MKNATSRPQRRSKVRLRYLYTEKAQLEYNYQQYHIEARPEGENVRLIIKLGQDSQQRALFMSAATDGHQTMAPRSPPGTITATPRPARQTQAVAGDGQPRMVPAWLPRFQQDCFAATGHLLPPQATPGGSETLKPDICEAPDAWPPGWRFIRRRGNPSAAEGSRGLLVPSPAPTTRCPQKSSRKTTCFPSAQPTAPYAQCRHETHVMGGENQGTGRTRFDRSST